jgi:hypothetical protein
METVEMATPRVEIPANLLKVLDEGRCVFFVGSGVSIGEGLPSSAELASLLHEDLKSYSKDSELLGAAEDAVDNLATMASLYEHTYEPAAARLRIVQEIERRQRQAKSAFHRHLRALHSIEHVITTNWDTLIEDALDASERVVIAHEDDLRMVRPRWTNVYKIHGCMSRPNEMLLDTANYALFRKDREAFVDLVKSLLRRFTFVCIGYSMQDHNFQELVGEVLGSGARKGPHFFVIPGDAPLQKAQFDAWGFTHISASAMDFISHLREEYETGHFSPGTARLPLEDTALPEKLGESYNPFEMYDTEALAEADPQAFVRYFIPPVEYPKVLGKHNVVVEGHRGSGKSMVFRYLSLFHEHVRSGALPFWGFYVKLESGFFDAVERTIDSDAQWSKYFQHYFNLVVATGLLKNVQAAISNQVFSLSSDAEQQFTQRVRQRLLRSTGQGFGDSLPELSAEMYAQLDAIRDEPDQKVFKTTARFIEALLSELSKAIPALSKKWWAVFLDEWDNLSQDQQRAVVMRLHDRSGRLRFKVAVKTLGFIDHGFGGKMLDITHDYQFVCLDHNLFSSDLKAQYFTFLEKVGNRRLELGGAGMDISTLLPASTTQPVHGYDYSGFEIFAMLSSGLVREFLELCKDALYCAFPEIVARSIALSPIPAKWQNHAAAVHAAIHFNNHRGCPHSDDVAKLMFVLGSVFHAIDRATAAQVEYRKPLSFTIPDFYDVKPLGKQVLTEAVANRLLQTPEVPLQPRNPEEGAKEKYILHRMICPFYKLSVYERYSVPVRAEALDAVWRDPHAAISKLTKGYKAKGVAKFLPSRQTTFWDLRGEAE